MRIQFGLREKGQRYHAAVVETLARPPDRIGDPLVDAFCDSIYTRPPVEQIQQSQGLATEFGRAPYSAVLTVQQDFWYYQELSQHVFAEYGLTGHETR